MTDKNLAYFVLGAVIMTVVLWVCFWLCVWPTIIDGMDKARAQGRIEVLQEQMEERP